MGALEHRQVADAAAVRVRVGEEAALRRLAGRAQRRHDLGVGHAGGRLLERRRGRDRGAQLAEVPALDQAELLQHLVAADHLVQQLARRDAGMDLVAAGADLARLPRVAEPRVEEPRIGLHAGPDPGLRDLLRRRAGFDRELQAVLLQRQRRLQPPPDGAAGARGQHRQRDQHGQQPASDPARLLLRFPRGAARVVLRA